MLNFEYLFFRQTQLKKSKQIFNIRNVQIDVVGRTSNPMRLTYISFGPIVYKEDRAQREGVSKTYILSY